MDPQEGLNNGMTEVLPDAQILERKILKKNERLKIRDTLFFLPNSQDRSVGIWS